MYKRQFITWPTRIATILKKVESRAGKRAGLVVAASAATAVLLASGSLAHNEICSNADYQETVLSIFHREEFDRPNRVAVDASRTTNVSSGKILATKTAVPGGLEIRLLPCWTTMGRNRFLKSRVVR